MPTILKSLRVRITLWYMLLVTLTMVGFSIFIYFRLQQNLISQLDTSLEIAASQAVRDLENDEGRMIFSDPSLQYLGQIHSYTEDGLILTDGTAFEITDDTEIDDSLEIGMIVEVDAEVTESGLAALEIAEYEDDVTIQEDAGNLTPSIPLDTSEFVYRIVAIDGTYWDSIGDQSEVPFPVLPESSFSTLQSNSEYDWRVYSIELTFSDGGVAGWLQAAASMEPVSDALESVQTQLFWGIPIAIALASLGGLFLADRGLRPIDRVTRTAQTITSSALNRRIDYKGANDEVGRLANTFDAMLERLENAFVRERRFTSDASHELRTPLTAIKGRLDVTLSNPRSESEYRETLETMNSEVDRLIRLSNELLFLSRLDQGEISWQMEDVSLDYLLSAVIDQIRPLAETKNQEVIEEISSNIAVKGDSDHLIRLFLNLLDNAHKHTPEGGQIKVQASKNGTSTSISFSDTGPGIPGAHLEHIFDRFYRVDEARTRDTGGTGLGLAIAREIVQLHHGKLEVESEVGSGTTFRVTLPSEMKK